MPSSLVLPVVPGVSVPTALPACPSLRNEPCRPYQAIVNNVDRSVSCGNHERAQWDRQNARDHERRPQRSACAATRPPKIAPTGTGGAAEKLIRRGHPSEQLGRSPLEAQRDSE